MDEKNENQEELTEEEKIIKRIEETEDTEELIKLLEKINTDQSDIKVKIQPIPYNGIKRMWLLLIIESFVIGLVTLGLNGLFNTFKIYNNYGLIIYTATAIVFQFLVVIVLRFLKNPFIMLFSNIITNILIFIILIIAGLLLRDMIFSHVADLIMLVLATIVCKILIMSLVKKIMRGRK